MILTITTRTRQHPRRALVWHQVEISTSPLPQQGYLKYTAVTAQNQNQEKLHVAHNINPFLLGQMRS